MRCLIQESKLHAILDRQQRKWERLSIYLKHLPKEPMVLITEIFKGGDLFLAERLNQEGEHVLLDAQSYWMSHLLPALSEYFGTEEITIGYDETVPLAPLMFFRSEQVIAICSPYWRTFEEVGVPGQQEMLDERNRILLLIEEKEAEILKWAEYEENPVLMGEDDTWLFAKATINPKKYKKLARQTAIEVQQDVQNLRQQVTSIELKLQVGNDNYLETSYYLDRIKKRVEKWGDFQFFAPTIEGE